ncbi:hypothetical protein CGC50_06430 [Capnocytophaga gingivalis]|uniref:Uncharacterized protein n=2 Tax=Capnocytophaga gingivalis TaxID=1017 RepID=A0A250FS01_9FLAO|nr:hypothetical protein CGC50_06430 [Capnocytophaga gingivalis]
MLNYKTMLDTLISFFKRAWDFIKKIAVAIFNFFANIVNWFKARYNRIKQKHPNIKAVSIKLKSLMDQGQYNEISIGLDDNKDYIANTFYDESTGEIIEEETEIIKTENLDEATKSRFGNKEMIVLT